MPTIVRQPPSTINAAYAAIPFLIFETTDVGVPPVVEVSIFVDGVKKGIQKHKPGTYSGTGISTNTAGTSQLNQFEIDISDCVQGCFDNDAPLCNPDSPLPSNKADCIQDVYIEVYSWIADEDGILVRDDNNVATSQTYQVINASFPHCDSQTVSDYLSDENGLDKYLTCKPVRSCICLDDNECLYFLSRGVSILSVAGYDESGAIVTQGASILSTNAGEIWCMSVGAEALNNLSYAAGSVNIDENIAYYDLTLFSGGGIFENRRYYVLKCCDTAYRIHFLNKFGKFDAFSIMCNTEDIYDIDDKLYDKSLPMYIYDNGQGADFPKGFSSARGRGRLYAKGTDSFIAHAQDLRREEKKWLKELMISPNIFLEKDGKMKSVYVKKKKDTIYKKGSVNNKDLILEFTYSNSNYSQRN